MNEMSYNDSFIEKTKGAEDEGELPALQANEGKNKILENEIKGSMVVSYSDFIIEDNKFENQTLILGADAIEGDLKYYLYKVRSMNIRVILLLKNKKDKNVRIALQNGIYDLIFGNFYTSQIKDLLERPNTFKDISKLYSYNFDVKLDKDKKFRK